MNLSEKIKHLREVEGELRGFGRAMTQMEVVRAMQEELGETISQAYLSQLENGKRVHLTATSRDLLARFFKVQPGYLVSDLADFSTDLLSELEGLEGEGDRLLTWLEASAEEWRAEPLIQLFFERLASVENPRRYIAFFTELLDIPAEDIDSLMRSKPRNVEQNGASQFKSDIVN
jgi:transcriptional regulator with XRE-family HTH domain